MESRALLYGINFRGFFTFLILMCGLFSGCKSEGEPPIEDPHVVPNPGKLEEDPEFISPPRLAHPIYACATNVTILNFLESATIDVFIQDSPGGAWRPAANPGIVGTNPILGVNFDVGENFVAGQSVRVTQRLGGITSDASNVVPVTSHLEDYPSGLPTPRLFKHPLHQCGKAVLVEDLVPGSKVEVLVEKPLAGGGFDSPDTNGFFLASTEWGHNWTRISPEFPLGARVTARASLCTTSSDLSPAEIAEVPPVTMPPGTVRE